MLTWFSMMPVRTFCATLLVVLFAFTNCAHSLHVDFYKNHAEAAAAKAARSQLHARGRRLSQGPNDTICYLGCLVAPIGDPSAAPLPRLLLQTDAPMKLQDCHRAAVQAGVTFFAVAHIRYCYGGDTEVEGWAYNDSCTPDCLLGRNSTNTCTTPDAFSFSMGICLRLDVPCAPDVGPQQPQRPNSPALPPPPPSPPSPPPSPQPPPPFPPPPPSPLRPPASPRAPEEAPDPPAEDVSSPPPPPLPPAEFECRDNTSLAGVDIAKFRLSRQSSTEDNIATCHSYCVSMPGCKGYFFKTTLYCFIMKEVTDYKRFSTSIIACRLL
ncbi:hypothetical protein Vafri_17548 [Volvox africanus]|uniref:Apple domain-containing protein n=1 Tax=Volvox africanus TaxID=51714 RepID=A0A8J4BQL1_9CHLO|nr:hypothetical protein Vafri_17548 [Volvox africanus]